VFSTLANRLLEASPDEAFALLFGKREVVGRTRIIKIIEIRFARSIDYESQSAGHVRLKREYIYDVLCDLTERLDVDTLIDVHTHPFAQDYVAFSGIDDADEKRFAVFLGESFPDILFASIVLSQTQYAARVWDFTKGALSPSPAMVRTQTLREERHNSEAPPDSPSACSNELFARAELAVGAELIRTLASKERVTIVGLGGLGSVIAENLVHMGFSHLTLIDPDILELSNISRVAGAKHAQAISKDAKVVAVQQHLTSINPDASISALQKDINDPDIEEHIANSNWLIVATDNHSSRFRCQLLSLKYFVPLISAGVNITIQNDVITDVSGEVIIAKIGDNLCLHCLGRLNFSKIAYESHSDMAIRDLLVARGYVQGAHVKEPAVKTLNSIVGALAVDALLNQYTGRQISRPITVYENNNSPAIYIDDISVENRNKSCYLCSIDPYYRG
jgi:molybdopterin/thiamine biosynthesis adenylyltransferase